MDPASSSTRSSPAFSLRFFCRDKSGPSADWNISTSRESVIPTFRPYLSAGSSSFLLGEWERLNLPCKGQREKEVMNCLWVEEWAAAENAGDASAMTASAKPAEMPLELPAPLLWPSSASKPPRGLHKGLSDELPGEMPGVWGPSSASFNMPRIAE